MINGYTIRKVNGKDIMYLFFDFNYEFSSFDFMAKREKIHDVVRNFIRDHNIVFKGATIALVSGGVLFGSINLSNPSFSQVSMNNNVSIEEKVDGASPIETIDFVYDDSDDTVNIDSKENDSQILNKEVIETSNTSNNFEENVNFNNAFIEKVDSDNTSSVNQNYSSPVYEEPIVDEPQIEEYVPEVDNNIYVNVKRSDGSVFKLELEDYVTGVVAAEMPALFNSEALKAQAVIARTYALKANNTGRVLSDNESTQSYKDNWQLSSMWGSNYDSYYAKVRDAVMSTKGMYLTYNGQYIEAVYHSTSNGRTEDSINVWGDYYPYLVSVQSIYDNSNPSFSISKSFSYDDLSSKLGISVSGISEFNILGYTSGGRVSVISVDGVEFNGVDFRSKLGLRSADFDVFKSDTGVVITTRGYGHGVGMSQYGANGLAKAGYGYRDILLHYYSGVSIEQL